MAECTCKCRWPFVGHGAREDDNCGANAVDYLQTISFELQATCFAFSASQGWLPDSAPWQTQSLAGGSVFYRDNPVTSANLLTIGCRST